jgi:diguanylate cyclase (GGDEF)-like protein
MDVKKAYSIPTISSGGSKKEKEQNPKNNRKRIGQDYDYSVWKETEAFAIDGLLAGNLNPQVSKAFERLANQIEPLRTEIELTRRREAHFRELSEQHSFLPILGRREFSRELSLVLSNLKDLNSAVLIILHLVNGDDIRQRLGRYNLDCALKHIAEVLKICIQSNDIIGNMGGNDFGLVILSGDMHLAKIRKKQLFNAISSSPYMGLAVPVDLEIAIGIAMLKGKMTKDSALQAADQSLLNYLSVHIN